MGLDLASKFLRKVRRVLGLPEDGSPPSVFHLGLYRAKVVKCADDGSTCDLQPVNDGIAGAQNVRVRVGVPGLQQIVQPGAVMLLGWEGGNPGEPYCVPSFEDGATVIKLILAAQALELAGNTYSAPQWDSFIAALKTFVHLIAGQGTVGTLVQVATALNNIIGAATTLDGAIATAGSYKSLKVKYG
jgi:hypothetical protein